MTHPSAVNRPLHSMAARAFILGTALICTGGVACYASEMPLPAKETSAVATASGTVTDNTGEPLPGVTVSVHDTKSYAATDLDGNFSIKVRKGDKIVFSYIGYAQVTVTYDGHTPIKVVMEEDQKALDEVVVVGYGTQKKTSSTAAVSSMKTDAIAQKPVANITNSMAGRVSGVIAKQGSGEPGCDGASLKIRVVDMGKEVKMLGFQTLNRKHGEGWPSEITMETSLDGSSWEGAGTYSMPEGSGEEFRSYLPGFKQARYFRLTITAVYNGKWSTHLAEINAITL